jgi:hypothetical protein
MMDSSRTPKKTLEEKKYILVVQQESQRTAK